MVARLKEHYAIIEHAIHEAVGLSDPARPSAWAEMLEMFRLTDALKGVAQGGLNQLHDAERALAIVGDPPFQVFEEVLVDNARLRSWHEEILGVLPACAFLFSKAQLLAQAGHRGRLTFAADGAS
jgi:hypothetical protein